MPRCKHCQKYFKKGNDKGSLKRHCAAVKAAKKRSSSKTKTDRKIKTKKRMVIIDGKDIRIEKCPKCGKLVEASNLKKHKDSHKIALKASRRNIQSEIQFVKKLKRQNPKSLVFQTGKESGVPDIVFHNNSKLIFYEIKPTKKESEKRSKLKKTQVEWIQKNCFANGYQVYVVFYKGPTSKFKYLKKLLTRKNIEEYA